jgi:hypothetical protein
MSINASHDTSMTCIGCCNSSCLFVPVGIGLGAVSALHCLQLNLIGESITSSGQALFTPPSLHPSAHAVPAVTLPVPELDQTTN